MRKVKHKQLSKAELNAQAKFAGEVLRIEAEAVANMQIGPTFHEAVDLILDAVTDSYVPMLRRLCERVEALGNGLLTSPKRDDFGRLLELRRAVSSTRRVASLQREVLQALAFGDPAWVLTENRLYYRDVCDRTSRIVQMVDACREGLAEAAETHLCHAIRQVSTAGKTVAVLAALAAPLLLSACIYVMRPGGVLGAMAPVAHWAALGGSAAATLALLIVLIKKRWV